MLTISPSQQRKLSSTLRARYIRELKERLSVRNPELAAAFDEARMQAVVEGAVDAAEHRGFTQRGPIRLYLDLCIAFGSGFVDDPLYPWAREAIGSPDPATQTERAEALFASSNAAFDAVRGKNDEWARAGLESLLQWAQQEQQPPSDRWLGPYIVNTLASLHPQKANHAGDMGLRALVKSAADDCAMHGTNAAHAIMLLSALKFTFGAGCLNDPTYGWMSQILADERAPDPSARFERLRRVAINWARTMLAERAEKA